MLSQSCETIPGVGPLLAAKLAKCGIKTLSDLLFHLPYRYQDRTRITPIQDLRPGDYCVIAGKVLSTEIKQGRRPTLFCTVKDKTGFLRLRFFHFNKHQVHALNASAWLRAFGEVRQFANQMEMIHPEYRLLSNEYEIVVEETLTPIYSSTEGLTQNRLRQLMKTALALCQEELQQLEWMTPDQLTKRHFLPLTTSITLLHTPPPHTSIASLEEGKHPALQRMIFEEFLAHRLSVEFARRHRKHLSAPVFNISKDWTGRLLKQFPYRLTAAQQRVSEEIAEDLAKDKPMLRLVQGDVGCGKTTVAALAALQAVANKYQVALMAPTELLSEQHASNLEAWLAPLGIVCCHLSGKKKLKARREILAQLAEGTCHLLIGTHAIFQQTVQFKCLGLIIIDEQHRFGVEQRLLLQHKGHYGQYVPHQLLLTATPIPRTLAMTRFAHLDISFIDELPSGRTPIHTVILNQEKREAIIERLDEVIRTGMQAYWVCTLIEESEKLQCNAASLTANFLQEKLPHVRVGLVHGRMKSSEKERIMSEFKAKNLDLLVATTVIEVGVDVPNANLMIIENAERLGLSQLHQLRGRVGRGTKQAHCLLLYQLPLSSTSAERLRIIRSTTNGFIIAEKDLELRGGGELLSTRQTGFQQFKIANLIRDQALLLEARAAAKELLNNQLCVAERIATQWLGKYEYFLQG